MYKNILITIFSIILKNNNINKHNNLYDELQISKRRRNTGTRAERLLG